jgi:hypothetical protein
MPAFVCEIEQELRVPGAVPAQPFGDRKAREEGTQPVSGEKGRGLLPRTGDMSRRAFIPPMLLKISRIT